MRISDWSSDVCSSDLPVAVSTAPLAGADGGAVILFRDRSTEVAGFLFKHDGHAIANGERQFVGGANKLLLVAIQAKRSFAKRTNQTFKQAGFHAWLRK